ncbi:hypothetical protein PCANC_23271 [Puccinia coronata f. sp. avenae]|uniref:Uncharacterized protein n=1 Tax=Puccinia coronata f. sp. avenae TaxID=200324 RepID=A0A2N5TY72_9BASI|nr:hypothetical protein PCANC_23271 [Puccinia coronata f. sp. avenae]
MSENKSVTNGEAQVHTPPKILDDPTGLPQSTRQSSRLQTPISRPEFIAPLSDSCQSLATNTNRTRPKPGSKKSSTAVSTTPPDEINEIPSESEDGIQVPSGVTQRSKRTRKEVNVDLSQDSDNDNNQVALCPKKDTTKDRDGFDHCWLYFHAPGTGPNQEKIRSACPGRPKAIESGCKLPLSAAELVSAEAKPNQNLAGTLISYTSKGRFSNTTLNKLLVIWIPWLQLEDFVLCVCFDFACPSSQLNSWVWAASQAHQLYLEQHVWTAKGSHKAFVGITCCYIDNDWKYVCQHLAINTIIEVPEEDEEEDVAAEIVEIENKNSEDKIINPDDAEQAFPETGWEWNEGGSKNNLCDGSGIGFTLKKKQAEWKLWAGKLGYKGRGLIGGYGIRWNIAYDSRQRAYEGRRVIKQLLDNESDKYSE